MFIKGLFLVAVPEHITPTMFFMADLVILLLAAMAATFASRVFPIGAYDEDRKDTST